MEPPSGVLPGSVAPVHEPGPRVGVPRGSARGGAGAAIKAEVLLEHVLTLATVARRYRLELAEGQAVRPQPQITLPPKGGVMVRPVAR